MTFTLLSELGRGGMGVVWRARDEETGQIVALKLLRAAYADDPDYLERFTRELELTRRIHSAHVVSVLGYGVREGLPYLALEYVDGPSLRELLREHGPYGWPEARGLLAQVAGGLADAHAAGIVHRDVKPSNILLGSDGVAKLTDFGVSRGLDLTRVTGTSTMLGTPAYLAPEGPVDERSDLYTLGCVAYELLAGAVPFEGRSYQEVILRHVREAPDLAKLPPEARPIVGALLAKDPAGRPQSAAALLGLLAGTAGPSAVPTQARATPAPVPPRRRRRGVLLAAAALAVALLLVAVGAGLTARPGASPAPASPGASLTAAVVGSSGPSQAAGSPSLTPAGASPSARAGATATIAGTPSASPMTGDLSKATASTGAATPASSAGAHGVPTQPTVLPTPTPYVAPTPTPYVAPTPTPYVAPTPTPTPYVPPTPPPPAAPTGLTATATGPNSVVLTWNGSSGATGYVISNGSAELATVGGGTTTYTVGGLAAGTYMCFAVRAYNAAESSGWTPHACTSTATPPPTATPTPQPTPTPAPVCNVDATLAMSPSTSHANNGQDVTISIVLNTGDWYPVTSADLSIGTGTTNLQLDDPAWSDSVDSGGGDNHTYTRHVSVNAPRGVATVIATVRFKMISAVAVSQRVWWNSASIQSSSGCSGYPLTNISTWPDASVQNY